MAFHMTPTGGKKDPYSSFRKRGLLNTPIKQVKTKEEVKINAQDKADKNLASAEEYLSKEYFDKVTNENVKVWKKDSEGGDGTGVSWEEGFKIAKEKGYSKDDETFDEWKARATAGSTREERTSVGGGEKGKKDYEVQSLATFLSNKGVYQAKDMYTTVQKADGSGFEKRLKNEDELKSDLAYHDDGEGLMQEWRDHVGGYTAKDATMDISKNVVKGTLSKEDSDQPDLSNASDKTLYDAPLEQPQPDAPVEQLSPVRKLMNKYMPKKSMAKQGKKEEVIGDDGKPIKGPIGSEYVVHADRSKGGYGEMTSIDGKKVTKSSRQSDVYFEKYRP